MINSDTQRVFNMGFSDLISFTKDLIVVLERDLSDLSIFGLTSDNISNLSDLVSDFENMRNDIEFEGDVMIKTDAKNNLAEQIKDQIRFMNVRVDAAFGVDSVIYSTFRFGDLNLQTDKDLLDTFQRIIRMANQYMDDLSSYGVNSDLIENLVQLASDFSNAMIVQEQAIDARRLAASDRTRAANDIYTYVSNYTNFGKKFYARSNAAKYKDYVIYSEGTGGSGGGGSNAPAAPSNFRYDYAERMIRWNSVSGATSYSLESSSNNVDWEEIYQGDATEYNTGEMLAEHTYLRIRSHSINGYSPYANLNIVYDLVLNGPANLTHVPALPGFTWNSVANATAYEVQLRDASATDDDYINLYFGNSTQLYHADQVGTYYVRIRAWNNQGTSAWMLLAYQVNP